MLAIAALLFVVVGATLGLLGGGGSILTLPLLVHVVHVEPREAIAVSLLIVGVTSAAAVIAHGRRGRVAWRAGLVMGLAGMAGAYAGGSAAHFVPAEILLIAFGVIMLVTGVVMLRGRRSEPAAPHGDGAGRPLPILRILVVGLAVGSVAGLVGAGGGFLVVPALLLFGGLPMPRAVGTSLFVIALQSFAGFGGHIGHVHIDWTLAAIAGVAAVAGSLAGERLAGRLPAQTMRRAFGGFVLAIGALFLLQRIPPDLWRVLAGLLSAPVVIALLLAAGLAAAAAVHLVRRHNPSPRT